MNETVKKNLALIAKQSKVNVCIETFNRRVEVLRYLSGGKKNHRLLKFLA
jgi:hypothetical protein